MCNGIPEQIAEFTTFMNSTEAEKKSIESETKQAEILKLILGMGEDKTAFHFKALELLEKLNTGKDKNDPHRNTKQWLYKQLRDMNFKEITIDNARVRVATEKNILSLCERYGVPVPKIPIIGQDIPF